MYAKLLAQRKGRAGHHAAPLVMLRASLTRSLPMDETLEAGVVLVRGSAAGFAQEIRAGRHRFLADEPVADGGTDTGPGPYDLLLGALGA